MTTMKNSDVKLMDVIAAIVIERGGEIVVSRAALEDIFGKYELILDGNGETFRILASKVDRHPFGGTMYWCYSCTYWRGPRAADECAAADHHVISEQKKAEIDASSGPTKKL